MDVLTGIAAVGVMAILVEAVVDSLKMIYDSTKRADIADKLVALGVSEVLCILGSVDLFSAVGVPLTQFGVAPWAGFVATGAMLWRGAGFVHELIKTITEYVKPSEV